MAGRIWDSDGATMRLLIFLLALGIAAPALLAQDEREEIDLAVGFPANTLLYAKDETSDYWAELKLDEIFAGIDSADFAVPDLGEIVRERLELPLTDEEITLLSEGVEASAFGLLDIGVSSPRLQVVIDHSDLAPLQRALDRAHEDRAGSVTGVEDYDNTNIYELYLPAVATPEPEMDPWGMRPSNPAQEWLNLQEFWAAIIDNRFLVVATTNSAVKDAVDFLTFPEDPMDTLLGNSRYREAVADFEDPQGVLFVNVQSVIATLERLGGDQGTGGIVNMIFQSMMDSSGDTGEFVVGLIQYEQFKSFAAAMWIDQENLTARVDANLVFHNAPAWLDALRVEPAKMPLAEMIPDDAIFALTDSIDEPAEFYRGVKDFFITRARNAGQDELADAWEEFEETYSDHSASIDKTLEYMGTGQAVVVLPGEGNGARVAEPNVAGLIGVRDYEKARDYLYDDLIPSKLGESLREAETELSPIIVADGVEIHTTPDESWGFALIRGHDGDGVFVIGQTHALKRVAAARAGSNILEMDHWRRAKGMLWGEGSMYMYMNFGEVLGLTVSGALNPLRAFMATEEDSDLARDDTKRDEDPGPYLGDFFRDTVVAGSVRSNETSINLRITAAGWPDADSLRGMALHFRDVQLNVQARDDYVRLREGARDYLVLQGEPATDVQQLLDRGYVSDEGWLTDPFGAAEGDDRPYALAPVPADVDIRQAVLCAYQAEPGLRGNHLCVLWNSHVVELTPEGLASALELAAEGKPLARQTDHVGRVWYREEMKPLYEEEPPEIKMDGRYFEADDTIVEVTIIDEDGDEAGINVDADDVVTQTEAVLDAEKDAGDE